MTPEATEHFVIVDGDGHALNGVCANIEEAEASVAEIQPTSAADTIVIMKITKTPVARYTRSVDWATQTVG